MPKKSLPSALHPGTGKYGKGRLKRRQEHHKKLGLPEPQSQGTGSKIEEQFTGGVKRGPGAWGGRRYNKQTDPVKR